MKIQIEKATFEDADSLLDVQNKSFISDYQRYGICPSYNQTRDKIISHINDDNVYKILENEKIIGDIVVLNKGDGIYHLQCICVIPEYENCGVGNIAMHFIENEFPDANHWTLVTPWDKLRNHHFYKKYGFEATKEFFTETVRMSYFEKSSTAPV